MSICHIGLFDFTCTDLFDKVLMCMCSTSVMYIFLQVRLCIQGFSSYRASDRHLLNRFKLRASTTFAGGILFSDSPWKK